MKKILGLLLVLCLVLILSVDSFAASKLQITKQPQTSTTSKNGVVTFEIKVSGALNSLTWYFIDPATGEKYTGKTVAKAVKGLRVTNPNAKKIKLSKVPKSMHGWTVYCHVNGNGYKLDSDKVMLLVYGLEPPENTPAEEISASEQNGSGEENISPAAQEDSSQKEKPETDNNSNDSAERDEEEMPDEPEDKTITVSCTAKVLRVLNSNGTVAEGQEPVSRLEFTNTGSFIVSSENPIKSYTINGILIEPAEPVNEFKIMNVTSDISLNLKINRVTAASAQVDTSHMCRVTCDGCTFTYLSGGLRSVTEGEVPAGAPVNIIADTSDLAKNGYRINGAEPINQELASFRLIITDDTEISTR